MKTNTKKIAFGGILLALFIAAMYIDAIVPVLDRSFLLLGSFFVMVAIIETGFVGGLLFYISANLLGMLVLPTKSGIIFFGVLFGLYALEKYFADMIPFRLAKYIAKLIFANISLVIMYFLFKGFFLEVIPDKFLVINFSLPVIIIVLAAYQVIFLAYDWFLSLFAIYYYKNIRKLIKIKG